MPTFRKKASARRYSKKTRGTQSIHKTKKGYKVKTVRKRRRKSGRKSRRKRR